MCWNLQEDTRRWDGTFSGRRKKIAQITKNYKSSPTSFTMSDKRNIETKMDDSETKKAKVDQPDNAFMKVGDAVEQIDGQDAAKDPNVIYSEDLRTTGALDAEGRPVQELESLCMNCHKQGTTRLLLTSIPYFREVIIMSFECPHCGFKNNEIQPATEIQEKAVRYTVQLTEPRDLSRQVVKSDSCTCQFVELDVEIPAKRGQLTTIEGLLQQMLDDLEADQPARKEQSEATWQRIEDFLAKLRSALNGEVFPLTFKLDDPAGNSWVEFIPGEPPHKWSKSDYFRTVDQARALGMAVPEGEDVKKERNESVVNNIKEEEDEIENLKNEVHTFPAHCPACHGSCDTKMKIVNIPHFKDVIIMATVCDHCGYKSNEVKTGGEIPDMGRKITLKVEESDDLARDILKSETCGLVIPELNLDLTPGTLGGRFTTLEGLLRQVHQELYERVFTETSDSMESSVKANWEQFLGKLNTAIEGNMKFTVVMEDPLAASYIQNVYAPDDDPNMEIVDYVRTDDENESLGLTDMKA